MSISLLHETEYAFFFRGLVIAVIFGVPAGAIGALTIQRTIERGFRYGLATGMGSAAADTIYATVSVFGISIVSDFLLKYRTPIRIVGCALVFLYGVFILKRKDRKISPATDDKKGTLLSCFFSSFAVAILNPATILSFTIAFASFDVSQRIGTMQGFLLITGIFVGTGLWWLGLSGAVTLMRKKITEKIYRFLNCFLGILLILFSLAILGSLFFTN